MFNSCNFNNIKFNSTCVREAVIPPIEPTGGGIRLRERKKKIFRREFFNIIGTKLIFNEHIFDIIGFILLAKHLGINLRGKTLQEIQTDLDLKGQLLYPFKSRQEILGFTKFKEEDYLSITGRSVTDLIPIKYLQLIQGTKLIPVMKFKTIKGSKSILSKQMNLIKGKKDISEILEALDLLNLEE